MTLGAAVLSVGCAGPMGDTTAGETTSGTTEATTGESTAGPSTGSGPTESTSQVTGSETDATTSDTDDESASESSDTTTTGEPPADPPAGDVVTYAGAHQFHRIKRLSDGTLLLSGQATNLDWLPADTETTELVAAGIDSASAGNIGLLVHVSADLSTILHVVHFPAGSVRDVVRMRSTEVPGEPTGELFISGRRDTADVENEGYYLAKLDNNFVDGPPSGVVWTYNVRGRPRQAGGFNGESHYKSRQPWDVQSDGRVVYGLGSEYDFSWAAIERLSPEGVPEKVPGWPGQEWDDHSAVVMKAGRHGSLRSPTQADYDALLSDGNGRDDRQGTWPDDYYFSGPCPDKDNCPGGPGYTGYRTSDKPTQRVGDIVIDRRSDTMYFGYSTQSVLPSNLPDFEPAVVAMDSEGYLLWWSRLYHERIEKDGGGFHQNSTPDQYVDDLEIDYTNDRLVVLARAHGNNVINFWSGDQIAAQPGASGFQNRFTGTSGNIHISWLGKLSLAEGTLHASTYVAEYVDGDNNYGAAFDDGLLAGWPNPNAGWPDLNTTRCHGDLAVDGAGHVLVTCVGRRTMTTSNAYQQMLKPGEGSSTWNAFARVYRPDLSGLVYSTLLVGTWDPENGAGGGNTELRGSVLIDGVGLYTVGAHTTDEEGMAKGNPVPVAEVPMWGQQAPDGETALVGYFSVDSW